MSHLLFPATKVLLIFEMCKYFSIFYYQYSFFSCIYAKIIVILQPEIRTNKFLIKIKRMKKILVAVMAVCTMVLGFTSCEKTADVNVYPIAGKTYQATDEDGYSRVTFKKNFGAVMEVKTTMQESYSDLYVWELDTKADQEGNRALYIKFANGAMNKITGEDLSGKTAFQGYYNGVNCYLYPMWPAEMPEAVLEYKPLLQ